MTKSEYLAAGIKNYKCDGWIKAMALHKDSMQEMKRQRPGSVVILHHIDPTDSNYELWENVVPMYRGDHFKLHNTGRSLAEETKLKIKKKHTGRLFTDSWCEAISKSKKGCRVWNKGLKGAQTHAVSDEVKAIMSEHSKTRKRDSKGHFIKT